MKNVEHFGDLTPRMNHFRDAVLEKNHILTVKEQCLLQKRTKKIKISLQL